jgi:UDP-GlcNAc:undecaprenyl-phosphate GlcNAc-1-phosphate transferase
MMEHALLAFAVLAVTTAVSAAIVPLSRILARRVGAMDPPGERKIHTTPMPRLGGLAVFVSFSGVVLAGYLAIPMLERVSWLDASSRLGFLREAHRVEPRLFALLAGAAVAFAVGFLDDLLGRRFSVWAKAVGQLVAAGVLIAAGIRTSFLPGEWANVAVTLLWVAGITNAFNLLDNMDGLSAGVALVASGVLLLNAWSLGELFVVLILMAFIGSLLGFLFFNFHPASVFLGDCGSLFIGYVMGSLTLLERYVTPASSSLFPVLMPVLVLSVPLIDTATVVFIRLKERRPIYVGDSRHLSHRLLTLGFTQRTSVLFIYLVTFCVGLGASFLTDASPGRSALILLQAAAFVALLMILLFFERRARPRRPEPPS